MRNTDNFNAKLIYTSKAERNTERRCPRRIADAKYNLTPNQTIQIGSNYKPSIYIAQIVQGSDVVRLKLIKK